MTTTVQREGYQCQQCKGWLPNDDGREPTEHGWLAYETETRDGRPLRVRLCATCRPGAIPVGVVPKPPQWDAVCRTCQASAQEDADADPEDWPDGVGQADAEQWKADHVCEPDVDIIPPKDPS